MRKSDNLKVTVVRIATPKPESGVNMKGCKFEAEPIARQHLKDDYRDPEPPELPPVLPFENHVSICEVLAEQLLIASCQLGIRNKR